MTVVDNSSQLSVFDNIRDALLANTTLNVKFREADIYEYEPKHKSSGFKGFPYIWINIGNMGGDKLVFDNNVKIKQFSRSLFLRVEYEARSKFRGYAEAVLKAIEDYESVFETKGFYDVNITLDDVDGSQVIQEKEIVEGVFTISFSGSVNTDA